MRQLHHRPTLVLQMLSLLCLAVCVGGTWFALQQPWLGVELRAGDGGVIVAGVAPHLAGRVPLGARLRQLSGQGDSGVSLAASDLIEDPDMLPSYARVDEFFTRQARLAALLRGGEVRLAFDAEVIAFAPRIRPLGDLPLVFWFQMGVGIVGFIIAAWVYLLRPADLPTRMFLVTGLMLFLSSMSAALYSTRELALPGTVFRWLSFFNHAGAMVFGCALVVLFASYPRRLIAPRRLFWLPVVFGIWLVADTLHLARDPTLGIRVPCLLQLLLAIACVVAQWRASRAQPPDRAALRWLVLSTMLGCGLVTLNMIATLVSQGYTFGFFLLMYLGIALGLGKYRLFDLDEWAYRILLWLAGASAILACDALLIYAGLAEKISLGFGVLICGGLYFPFRQWLWQRLVDRGAASFETLVPQVSTVAFLASAPEQSAAWDGLLRRMFDPLEIVAADDDGPTAGVRDNGLGLFVPSCHGLAARSLRYAGLGRRLFSSRDARVADSLAHLMRQVMAGRVSYEQGVQQERLRVGRDLHDNIGARLLKLIHHLRGSSGAELAREAMKDLRTAVAAIDGKPVPLADALADWHAETEARCEVAGTGLAWTQDAIRGEVLLQPRARAMLESVLRELVTNALKHAAPGLLTIGMATAAGGLRLSVGNDGQVRDPADWQAGYGLRNIRGRLGEFGGSLSVEPTTGGVVLVIETPLGPLS